MVVQVIVHNYLADSNMGNVLGSAPIYQNFSGTYGLWTPKRVWVIGYWRVWVMLIKSLRTNLGVTKMYGLLESMGYQGYGLSES